jgi:hypothetical protein
MRNKIPDLLIIIILLIGYLHIPKNTAFCSENIKLR